MKTTTIARSAARLAALAAISLTIACADTATGPADQEIAGTYIANANMPGSVLLHRYTYNSDYPTPPRDWLAEGAVLVVSLRTDGTTAGQLFVPKGLNSDLDYMVDLAGSWTLTDSTVRLAPKEQTFLEDVEFIYREGRLGGQYATYYDVMELVLVRR